MQPSIAESIAPARLTHPMSLAHLLDGFRAEGTPLSEVFRNCLLCLGYTAEELNVWEGMSSIDVQATTSNSRVYRTGLQVATLVENDRGPAYHNRDHAGETVIAATALIIAQFETMFDRRLHGLRLLVAMLGHDVGHPGLAPGYAEVGTDERRSAEMVRDCMAAYDSREHSVDRDMITDIIEGTEFGYGPSTNLANHREHPDRILYTLQVLANDADLLASILPHTGMQRSLLLAQEWQAVGEPAGDHIGTWSGRLSFLKAVHLNSEGADRLGLIRLHALEVQALERLDLAKLDRLTLEAAQRSVFRTMHDLDSTFAVPTVGRNTLAVTA